MNNFDRYIKEIIQTFKSKSPFVVFKKPNEFKLIAYFINTKEIVYLSDFKEEGFVFSPFNNNDTILFPLNKCVKKEITFKEEDVINNDFKSSFILKNDEDKTSKQKHIKLVQKAIDFIEDGKADKIVLSRMEKITALNFDLEKSFKKMLGKYPNAFVYIWFHPKIGLWMGATPEKLISVEKNTFKTMALAGTQVYKNKLDVNWKLKEQKEQQFVTNYIVETIKPFSKEVKITNPFTVKAGNLLHIRTDISAKLTSKNTLKPLIFALHPTPAVCGLPKNVATKFILENENYDRSYYTGFLGELNIQNKSNLFVNLRCMQLKGDKIHIYVGGGITKESSAEKEWEETENKALVIKSVL
ncbi:MAG: chorismate-binding protein [Lutibacter sp.]|uniref:chorismate-binding protein n=1 Tax=Lutibacter sp. TaxID=1925666 RepID=UPI00299D7C95|nr:chorismate-binding protein [Lutibacter sp.]MDX1828399.1 chorismate-binding protein [Lutibacter sp.]